jgi:hypothetical protein
VLLQVLQVASTALTLVVPSEGRMLVALVLLALPGQKIKIF